MTDEEALAAFLAEGAPYYGNTAHDVAEGFRAGLAHVRQWRPLTSDPASWPEAHALVLLAASTSMVPHHWAHFRAAAADAAVCAADGFTHWLPLPDPPPKGESK